MQTRIALFLLVLSALPLRAESPIAEVVCASRAQMVDRLTITYQSSVTATGLRDIDTAIEVWTDPHGRWTLVQTYTDGLTCILAMGEAWDMPGAQGAG